MAIEAQGGGYFGSNPSGVGAVYLGDMPDLLKNQQEAIDTEISYSKIRQAEQAQAAAQAQALQKAFEISEGALLPGNQPGVRKAISGLQEKFAKGFELYGNNLNSPQAQQYFGALKLEKNQIEQAVKTSNGMFKLAGDMTKKFDPSKHDKTSLDNINAAMNSTFDDLLAGKVPFDFSLKPIKGNLNTYLKSYLEPYNKKPSTTQVVKFGERGKGEIIEESTTQNFSEADAQKFANDIYQTDRNGAEIADEQWSLEDPNVKATYLSKYQDPSQPDAVAEVKAKKDWLADVIKTRQIISEKEAYKGQEAGYKEGVKFGYGQKEQAIKGRRFPEIVASLALGDPNMMRKVPLVGENGVIKNPDGSEKTVYGTTLFNQFPLKEKRVTQADMLSPPKEETDYITLAFKDDQTGKIHIETKFSRDDYAKNKKSTPYIKFNTPQEFMDYMANSAQGIKDVFGTPDQWIAYLDMKKARIGQNDWDATKVINWSPQKQAEAEKKKEAVNVYVSVGEKKSQQGRATEKQYTIKGKAYPESKIAEKAKASGMTIQEYVNELNK